MAKAAVLLGTYEKRSGSRQEALSDMAELRALVEADGVQVVGEVLQAREAGAGLGTGKLADVRRLVEANGADQAVTQWELRPSEATALTEQLGVPVADRTQVILDIFAQRAHSREGRLQVEMAQLTYLLPRLPEQDGGASRLGGGIGTRGPGETRLERERRHIRARLKDLRRELEQLQAERRERRQRRQRGMVPLVALVGYTNVGKSTLFETLTGRPTPVRDQVFVTLDPSVRRIFLPGFGPALLVDTVGFINRLPHHLVEAFRATLDEVREADLLLHVVDAASPRRAQQQAAVEAELERLGAGDTPVILVENQWDRVEAGREPEGVPVSALSRWNVSALEAAMAEMLGRRRPARQAVVPWSAQDVIGWIRAEGDVLSVEPVADGSGLSVIFRAPDAVWARVARRIQPNAAGRSG
jgi:GTP-binding protein HflX